VCKSVPGKTARHHAKNDIIYRAFTSAGIPATKEPVGLTRLDGKRPDGVTLVPWCTWKALTWDVTDSYVVSAAQEAGAPAELAASRKNSKYSLLSQSYHFQPIAVETSGVINCSAITAFGRGISSSSGEERHFLFRRISVTMQRFNAILLHNCLFAMIRTSCHSSCF